jgi:PleD family two-component response regulator
VAVERASFGEEGEPLRITISVGCAVAGPNDSPDSVFKRADLALYESKHQGRNKVTVAPAGAA